MRGSCPTHCCLRHVLLTEIALAASRVDPELDGQSHTIRSRAPLNVDVEQASVYFSAHLILTSEFAICNLLFVRALDYFFSCATGISSANSYCLRQPCSIAPQSGRLGAPRKKPAR